MFKCLDQSLIPALTYCAVKSSKIIQNKIKEYQLSSNKKMDANGNSTNDMMPKRHANNFIDECLKLSIQEKNFTEEELINESLTMLIGV